MQRTARSVPSSALEVSANATTNPIGARLDPHMRSQHLAGAMVRIWRDTTAAEPWHVARERSGDDPMIGVIAAILDVALSPNTGAGANEQLVRMAAAHGDQRRLQGIEESRLLCEYGSVAVALWNRLRDTAPIGMALSAVIHLDHVLCVARAAATQGYHRSDRAANPSWATQLEARIAACSTSKRPSRNTTRTRRAALDQFDPTPE